jgi:hypothetical protein
MAPSAAYSHTCQLVTAPSHRRRSAAVGASLQKAGASFARVLFSAIGSRSKQLSGFALFLIAQVLVLFDVQYSFHTHCRISATVCTVTFNDGGCIQRLMMAVVSLSACCYLHCAGARNTAPAVSTSVLSRDGQTNYFSRLHSFSDMYYGVRIFQHGSRTCAPFPLIRS